MHRSIFYSLSIAFSYTNSPGKASKLLSIFACVCTDTPQFQIKGIRYMYLVGQEASCVVFRLLDTRRAHLERPLPRP